MNKEILQKFCSPDNSMMNVPFSFGAHTYATNGHIIVRVPKLPDAEEGSFLNEKAAMMFDAIPDLSGMVELPELSDEEAETCRVCGGTGKTEVCPECNGEGAFTFSTNFNDYECECLSCNGQGEVKGRGQTCGTCYGTGKKPEWKRISIGSSGFATCYLRLMRDNLPGVKILPNEPVNACYFQFDGGDGFLMPMLG